MARAATSPGPRLRVKVDYWGNFEIRLPPLKPLSRLKLGWWEKVHNPGSDLKFVGTVGTGGPVKFFLTV